MKVDLETRLIHDGDAWVASNETITARGRTLEELDESLVSALRKTGRFTKGSKVSVFMGFDFSTIPMWLRQYASHYFNRCITVDI